MSEVPTFDTTIDYQDYKTAIESILKVIKPTWDMGAVTMKDLSIGYLNRNVGCEHPGAKGVFVRLVNNLRPGMTDDYKIIYRFLSAHGLSPKLLAEFSNGLCSDLVEGEALTWETAARMREEAVYKPIMRSLARFHSRKLFTAAQDAGIRDLQEVEKRKSEKERSAIWQKFLDDPNVPQSVKDTLPSLSDISRDREMLNKRIADLEPERGLVHMDVNPSNIILKTDGEVAIVDYDLTGISHCSYDIAAFFHGFINVRNPVMADYPDRDIRRSVMAYYLEQRQLVDGTGTGAVTDQIVDDFERKVRIFGLMTMYRYVFIGPFLSIYSDDKDKKYTMFNSSLKYYEEYLRLKAEII